MEMQINKKKQTKRRQEKKEENSRHRRFDVYLSTGFASELAGAAEGAPALETPDAPPIEAPLKRRFWRPDLVGVTAAGRFLYGAHSWLSRYARPPLYNAFLRRWKHVSHIVSVVSTP